MYHLYKITNKINNKIYIGVHYSKDITCDEYMGSGKAIKSAIKKYGVKNFERVILSSYEKEEDAYIAEEAAVDHLSENTYNIMPGGYGGWDYVNSLGLPNPMGDEETVKRVVSTRKKNNSYHTRKCINANKENIRKAIESNVGRKHSEKTCLQRSESLLKYYENNESIHKGVAKTDEHKLSISESWTEDRKAKKSEWMKTRISDNPDIVKTNLGKKFADSTKKKMSKSSKKLWEDRKKIKGTCPHCGKSGVLHNMKRWHFDNCRQRENNEL